MDDVTEYLRKARGVSQATFQQLYPHHFLFKHPKAAITANAGDQEFDYATRSIDINFDPMPNVTQVVSVKKNPENPFPDRLTIGRATNCDVVIRFAFISKVHAHLFVQGDKLTLRDNKASNGTFHNHVKLDAGGARSIKLGDRLGFGALELELVDAARLYQILRAPTTLSQSAPAR
jgi:pSer/pThr/pTyr-binding forkhead associated (FHA) protein